MPFHCGGKKAARRNLKPEFCLWWSTATSRKVRNEQEILRGSRHFSVVDLRSGAGRHDYAAKRLVRSYARTLSGLQPSLCQILESQNGERRPDSAVARRIKQAGACRH